MTTWRNRIFYGKETLRRWKNERLPFILYLRSFGISVFHGKGANVNFLLENHLWGTLALKKIGVLTVLNQKDTEDASFRGHGGPAIVLRDDEWKEVVTDLIGQAEMIISEVVSLTEGVLFELKKCAGAKVLNTIVLVPSQESQFYTSDHALATDRRFPRLILHDEIPDLHASEYFIFRDLLTRMIKLAEMPLHQRCELVDNNLFQKEYPVNFDGVYEGYHELAAVYESEGNLDRAWYSYYRSITVARILNNHNAAAIAFERCAAISEFLNRFDDAFEFLNYGKEASIRANNIELQNWFDERICVLKTKMKL